MSSVQPTPLMVPIRRVGPAENGVAERIVESRLRAQGLRQEGCMRLVPLYGVPEHPEGTPDPNGQNVCFGHGKGTLLWWREHRWWGHFNDHWMGG